MVARESENLEEPDRYWQSEPSPYGVRDNTRVFETFD